MKSIDLVLVLCAAGSLATGRAAAPVTTALGACVGSLRAPARVAADPAGNIYVSDPQGGQVATFDSYCRPVAIRGGFARPLGLAIDEQGRIYLAEEQKGSVSVFDPQWNLLHKLGIGDGEFLLPSHIAVRKGPAETVAYVSDSSANVVKAYAGSGASFEVGMPGTGDGQFDFPAGLCLNSSGELFVVDQNNDRVQVFDRSGNFLRTFRLGTGAAGVASGRAQGAFLDPAGRMYVADTFQGVVKVFDAASGAFLSTVGSFGQSPGHLGSPAGLALDPFNRLFVTSATTRRVEVYGIDSFLHVAVRPATNVVAAGAEVVFEAMAGDQPVTFQWQKDGVHLDGATNATFAVAGIDPAAAGGYSVLVTGPFGTVTSGVAPIRVLSPPVITANPQSLTVLSGSTVVMDVEATGSELTYQWHLNRRELPGATNRTLLLPEAQSFQAGAYSVVVANAVGSVLSIPATLTILVPPAVMEIVSGSMADDGFHLTLNADPGFRYSVDASADMFHWEPMADVALDAGMEEFVDLGSTNFWNRFYRFRWDP